MRLLSSSPGSPGKLSYTTFKTTLPSYAILSHTWADGEVSFQDLANGLENTKKGYRKVNFCAKQAKQDNLDYFWVDTCCIDKHNHVERSKAINSMFRWYQNAAKCYVILSDVSVSSPADITQQNVWEPSFRNSRWFRRGWTLQELVAPESVEFFTLEGYRLGDKQSLEELICEITGLPAKALQGHALNDFSLSERKDWAKSRKTTEPEDRVYCLLGILNILMIPSYGEGEESALGRLDYELEKINDTPVIVPFIRNSRFVGYESQLAELQDKMFPGEQITKIAIVGPGGIGKSQLALELAYQTRQRYKNCSIFWVSASDADSFYQSCSDIAQKLHIPGWDDENEDPRQLVQHHLSKESAGQWLLLYDDADDESPEIDRQPSSYTSALADFIPSSKQGCVIFTTTKADTADLLAPRNSIHLRELKSNVATRMLEKHLNMLLPITQQQEINVLLKELSHLPLAITQAAAYIKHHKLSIQEYVALLKKYGEKVERLGNTPSLEESQHNIMATPIARTCLIALNEIQSYQTTASDCLFFMACVYRKDVLQELLPTSSPEEIQTVLRILQTYGLVTKRPASSAVELHRLVHLTIRQHLQEQSLLDKWNQVAIIGLVDHFPSTNHENRTQWRRLLPHVKYTLANRNAAQGNEPTVDLAWKCALALWEDGRWEEAEKLFVQVMEARKTKLGADHPDTLTIMAKLASTFWKQGRWEEAEKLFVQVMEARKTKLGADHPDTLAMMANLASTFLKQGQWEEAEKLFAQAMKILKTKLGADHPDTLMSMANLASTFWNQGRWEEAKKLFIQVTETRKTKLGADHPDTLTSMANLASTYRTQGRWEESEKLEVQVMEIRKTKLGADHPDTLTIIANLASTFWNQGRWEEAENLYIQVIKSFQTKLGADHPSTLTSMANLASMYWNQGRWKEAEKLEMQVMETRRTKLGADHPDTLTSMANLAYTYRSQARLTEAINLMRQCARGQERRLGLDHPVYSQTIEALTQWESELSITRACCTVM